MVCSFAHFYRAPGHRHTGDGLDARQGLDEREVLMRKLVMRLGSVGLGFLIFAGQLGSAMAQEGRRREARANVTDLELDFRFSPKYQDTTSSKAKRTGRWLQLMLEYESSTREGWADTLTLSWFVILRRGSAKPILLSNAVQYVDVEDGRHYAAMYIRPRFLKRYLGDDRVGKRDMRVYVELRINGDRVERFHYPEERPPAQWWELAEPKVVVKGNELLARNETPFFPLDFDFYEYIPTIARE